MQVRGVDECIPLPDFRLLVNRAYQDFCWDAECLAFVETVAGSGGVGEYSPSGTYKTILDVSFAGNGLLRSTEEF